MVKAAATVRHAIISSRASAERHVKRRRLIGRIPAPLACGASGTVLACRIGRLSVQIIPMRGSGIPCNGGCRHSHPGRRQHGRTQHHPMPRVAGRHYGGNPRFRQGAHRGCAGSQSSGGDPNLQLFSGIATVFGHDFPPWVPLAGLLFVSIGMKWWLDLPRWPANLRRTRKTTPSCRYTNAGILAGRPLPCPGFPAKPHM